MRNGTFENGHPLGGPYAEVLTPSGRLVITAEQIDLRVRRLARAIDDWYGDREVVFLASLRGAFIFCADLVRAVSVPAVVDFLVVSSYGSGTESGGCVEVLVEPREPLEGRDLLIVDDIVDTGRTLHALRERLAARGARSIRACALLDKPSRRTVPCHADWVGFTIPDRFVVGYGLDHAGRYRGLPYITEIESSADTVP